MNQREFEKLCKDISGICIRFAICNDISPTMSRKLSEAAVTFIKLGKIKIHKKAIKHDRTQK